MIPCAVEAQPSARSAGASKSPALVLSNADLPVQESPQNVIDAVRKFHAALRDGNTTKILTLLAQLEPGAANKKMLLQKYAKLGQEIAKGKSDFFVVDVRMNGPDALAYVDRIEIPFDPKKLVVEPWYLVKEGADWKLLPGLNEYKPGKGSSSVSWKPLDAESVRRFDDLTKRFGDFKNIIGRDTFVAVPYLEETVQKIQEQRDAMWTYGSKPQAPPALTLAPGLQIQ